jgi:hypothetical protein
MNRIIFAFTLVFTMQTIHTQDIHIETLQDSIVRQLALYPQEKVHLHTDRNVYVPGEKIWFKAYLVDALTHIPTTNSKYIYVELIHSNDSLVSRVKIRPDHNQQYHGHLFLSDIIPEGNYTLRAYTRFMENKGVDYFFQKPIYIGQLNKGTDPDAKTQKKTLKSDYDVSFFPEGGNLMTGAFCRVAFKALSETGMPESITAKIVDPEGNVLLDDIKTEHDGMGTFIVTAQKGAAFFFESTNERGVQKRFPIPEGHENAYGISVVTRNKNILVSLKQSTDAPSIPLYLLAHLKGVVLYFEAWGHPETPIIFSNELFPSGIIQFMLLAKDLNPLSDPL